MVMCGKVEMIDNTLPKKLNSINYLKLFNFNNDNNNNQ